MKFAICGIVALCAFVYSHAHGSQPVDYNIQQEVCSIRTINLTDITKLKEFNEKFQEELKKLKESLSESNKTKEQVHEKVNKAKVTVKITLDDVLDKMVKAGDIPLKCIEEHHEGIVSITKHAVSQVENCLLYACEDEVEMLGTLKEYFDHLHHFFNNIRDTILQCLKTNESDFNATLCGNKRVEDMEKELREILKHGANVFINYNEKLVSIVVGTEVCLAKIVAPVNMQFTHQLAALASFCRSA